VRQELELGDHALFVGEVVDCGAPDEDAPLLRTEDTRLNYGG
jgi:flavin reductase (DIM6/NTAB) family NADH-FMN oxidoreductase RutF